MLENNGFAMKHSHSRKKALSLDETILHSHIFLRSRECGKQTRDDSALHLRRSSEVEKQIIETPNQKHTLSTPNERNAIAGGTPLPELMFLLHQMPWELSPIAPLTPFETSASVPFNWEDEPGKPKPEAITPKPHPRLQLPPRLHSRTSSQVSDRISHSSDTSKRHKHLMHIFHSIIPKSRNGSEKKKSKGDQTPSTESLNADDLHGENNELSACAKAGGTWSPKSIFHGLDAQSRGSSSSPTGVPTSSSDSLKTVSDGLPITTADTDYFVRGSFNDHLSPTWSDSITSCSSPTRDFLPADAMKASNGLLSVVENMKSLIRSWNKRGGPAGKNKQTEMEPSCSEVWALTLAANNNSARDEQVPHADQFNAMKSFDDEMIEFHSPAMTEQEDDQTISPSATIQSSDEQNSPPPLKFTSQSCRRKKVSQRWIFQKMHRSLFLFVTTWKFMKNHRLPRKKQGQRQPTKPSPASKVAK